MAATSARNLVAGSGTVSMTSGSKVLTFSQLQSLKEGATISCANGQLFTIDVGSGTSWTVMQEATVTASGQSFDTTDPSTSRARGSGVIVPNAVHNLYYADRDAAGNPDWFFYVDTIFPENGVHPYTKDWYAGPPWVSSRTVQALIPDFPTRVRVLEGALRGASGTLFSPDSRLSSLESKLVPVGCVMPYAGTTAPGGWLLCDGSAVSRTTYGDLLGVIGTAFGAGDGSTTFNVPDLRGRVAVGKDNMGGTAANRVTGAGTQGATGGAQTHTLSVGEMPSHEHGSFENAGGGYYNWTYAVQSTLSSYITPYPQTGPTGGGGAHNNLQPYQVLTYIIKATVNLDGGQGPYTYAQLLAQGDQAPA